MLGNTEKLQFADIIVTKSGRVVKDRHGNTKVIVVEDIK